MKFFVKVKPNSREEKVKKVGTTHFEVLVKVVAKEGKANKAAINALARFLDISKSRVKIIFGETSKQKIFEIK